MRKALGDRNNAFVRSESPRESRTSRIHHAELRYLPGPTRKYEFQMAQPAFEKSVKSIATMTRRNEMPGRGRKETRAREEVHFVISRAGAMSRYVKVMQTNRTPFVADACPSGTIGRDELLITRIS